MKASLECDERVRAEAFRHVRRLLEVHDQLSSTQLGAGFLFQGERLPLINPQRGIFMPKQIRFLLSIRTVYPRSGAKVWYDDQRRVHQAVFDGVDAVEYAFMGTNPDAADNRWLREAFEAQTPVLYFLGTSPGRYQAVLPTFIVGWDAGNLRVRLAFGLPEQGSLCSDPAERRYALRYLKQRLHQASFRDAVIAAYGGRCALSGLPEPML
jgi:putative restriction endonuclease